jgi:hypothetical protein
MNINLDYKTGLPYKNQIEPDRAGKPGKCTPPAPVYRRKEQKIEYEYRDRDR